MTPPPHPFDQKEQAEDFREIAERLHLALSAVVTNGKPPAPDGKPEPAAPAKKEDKKDEIPAFWRICGAALVSVTAMVAVTLYIQLSNTVGSLRAELNSIRDHNHDLVRKDDYNSRNLAIAATIKELQASNAAALELQKERALAHERQMKVLQDENKLTVRELEREVQRLRERLAVLENKEAESSKSRVRPLPK